MVKPKKNRFDTKSTMSVPRNFEGANILAKGLRSDSFNKMKDSMHFILNAIISLQDQKKYQDYGDYDGYVPLSSDILNSICGKRYKEALITLEDNGVIECDKIFKVGVKSYGYRLTEKFAASDTIHKELTDRIIRKKYLDYKTEIEHKNNLALDQIPYITKFFNSKYLTIDREHSHNYVEIYRKHMLDLLKLEQNLTADEIKVITNRINQRYNSAINSINKLSTGDYLLSRTGKDNRLHSSMSAIKKEFRSFIKYNGQDIVSIDVKSSQPYLLTQLLKPEFYKTGKNKLNLLTIYPNLFTYLSDHKELFQSIMSVVKPQLTSNQLFKNGFLDVKWDDDFYKLLIDTEMKLSSAGKKIFSSRSITKKYMMLILYYKENGNKNGGEVFKRLFPKEADLINLINSIKDENYLPVLLQRLESFLILDKVCKAISDALPNAPLLPVHDCIYTTEEYSSQVQAKMHKTLTELTGIEPGLKVESQTPQEALKDLLNIADADYKEIKSDLGRSKIKHTYRPNEKQIGLKRPLLAVIPKVGNKQNLSTRYID